MLFQSRSTQLVTFKFDFLRVWKSSSLLSPLYNCK